MVLATASRVLAGSGRTLHALTHVPLPGTEDLAPGWEADDGPYASRLAGDLEGVEWSPLSNRRRLLPIEATERLVERSWNPSFNPHNAVWLLDSVEHAERFGVPLMLTGTSGNATFSRGRVGALRSMLRDGDLGGIWREARARHRHGTPLRRVLHQVASESSTERQRRMWRTVYRRERFSLAQTVAVRPEALSDAGGRMLARLDRGSATREDWERFVMSDVARASAWQNFSETVWWSDPLSDPEVMTLALAIPDVAWLADGRDRGLARAAMEGVVPDYIRLRASRGSQAADVAQWVAGRRNAYRELLDRFRASPSAGQVIDLERLAAAVETDMFDDPGRASAWQAIYGRTFCVGQFAVWYEDEVLKPARIAGAS